MIAALPFFHVYGLHVILNLSLQAGATVVTMARFDFEQFLDLVERHRVTRAYVVPPIALALAEDPIVSGRDLSGLRHALSGAAPLGAELAEACERRLGCPVTEGFGMTEMSAITHLVPPFGEVCKPGSIGPPIPGVECRLVDHDTGEDVGPGQRGELWMRSAKVMQGYLNNAEATAATVDQDGWLRSGDIAVVDEEGWFTIVGRIKEIIKYKGFQVFPAELEMILIAHPGVADCAVIGVDDEEAGEVPQAFVVPDERRPRPKSSHAIRRRTGRALQAHPRNRDRRGDPKVSVRPGPSAGTPRATARGVNELLGQRRCLSSLRSGCSHAPTSCLSTGRNGSGQVALPLVVPSRRLRGLVARVADPASAEGVRAFALAARGGRAVR